MKNALLFVFLGFLAIKGLNATTIEYTFSGTVPDQNGNRQQLLLDFTSEGYLPFPAVVSNEFIDSRVIFLNTPDPSATSPSIQNVTCQFGGQACNYAMEHTNYTPGSTTDSFDYMYVSAPTEWMLTGVFFDFGTFEVPPQAADPVSFHNDEDLSAAWGITDPGSVEVTIQDISNASVAPEPSTACLLSMSGLGLIGVGIAARKSAAKRRVPKV
jgi:hypothetical protein